MNPLTLCAFALAAAGTAFGLWQWAARRRTLRKLNQMLDRAIAGGFVEDIFNETELSALESRLARFLQGSASARKTIEGEQAAVKTLIADISHQTRTPIANLLLYASLLSESELSPRQQELARSLMVQGEKLSFLIQALVKASRLEARIVAPVPAPNPVGPLLEGAAEQEERAARRKQITITASLFQGSAAFDPRWTGEALGNVVNNAVKYTPAGGTVTISAQMLDFFCRIDVADTGPGIPESEQAEVFNRFFRGKDSHGAEGLGLGLYLAREILTRQGGYIRVASQPGKGCVFVLSKDSADFFVEVFYYDDFGNQRSEKILWQRRHAGEGPGRGKFTCGGWRVCGYRRHVRLRQVHPAPHAGRAGPAYFRLCRRRRKKYFFSKGRGTDYLPAAEDRLCVPELQPSAGPDGI